MVRVGAVSYLNTKPLIETLPQRLSRWCGSSEGASLRLDLPSRLATDLESGQLDVALIPSVEYFRGQCSGYQIVSDAVIACRGPVWSVRLLSRVPVPQIRSLALDEGSRTSAAMVQVLLWERHRVRPTLVPFPIGSSAESIDADAILMIGDRAMHPARGTYQEIWDLGDRWNRWTELPFVFAMWVARAEVAANAERIGQLSDILKQSRNDGLSRFESIARREAASHGLTNEDLHRYFAENLHFTMGPGERLGLESFRQRATSLGLIVSHAADTELSANLNPGVSP